MLLSHRHRFLFVHLAKTGGTSVRAALRRGRWREPYAIPTWIAHRLSALCSHRIGARLPRHAPAIAAQAILPPAWFATLFKFAFVRNPWDRLVSAHAHFERGEQALLKRLSLHSFSDFVRFALRPPLEQQERAALWQAFGRPQLESLIGLRGELLVDFVGHFENLETDFQLAMQQMDLPVVPLPHKRRSQRIIDYRSVYSDELAELVGRHFADDLAAFNYSFDPARNHPTSVPHEFVKKNSHRWSNQGGATTIPMPVRSTCSEGAGEC